MTHAVPKSSRSPLRKLLGVKIIATGSFVPDQVVRNEDLAELGYDADWIRQRTGILERRHAPPEMATSDMAIEASKRVMESAGVTAADIDLVLLGTFTPDMPVPATACVVQDRLGIVAPAMDLQAACAGFVYAMITAMQYVKTGCSQMALVIGADMNSRVCNPADKKTYPLFGDGAGAVLVTAGDEEQGLLSYTLGADGSGAELLCRPMGGSRLPPSAAAMRDDLHFLRMDGRPVFKWAIRLLHDTITDVLDDAGVTIDDIDVVIFHQANNRIIEAAADDLNIPKEKLIINVTRYGNTSAASIPLALDEANEKGLLKRGGLVLLSGFGAGLAWGTTLVRW
jgi:3-oxoacyl-[acyl-carrier-protein] synthase-3